MAYDSTKHHRHSIRLEGYDYRCEGAYFITICTGNRACVFGDIGDREMHLSRRGMIALACWREIPSHRPYVQLDRFVVMPNHVHGIFWIDGESAERATQVSPLHSRHTILPGSVGAVVGSYKAAVSREINKVRPGAARDLWQPNYWEHIIRTQHALETLRDYVFTNSQRWESDLENPNGNGSDDVEAFVRSLDVLMPKEGDTSVAPTEAIDRHAGVNA